MGMRVHGKEPPQIMHQNNKGKPAPNPSGQYSGKHHIKHDNANFLQHQQATTAAATQQSQNVPHPTPNQTPLTQTQNHSQQPTSGGNPQNTQQHHSSSQQQLAQQQQQSSHNPDYQQQISNEHDNTNPTAA